MNVTTMPAINPLRIAAGFTTTLLPGIPKADGVEQRLQADRDADAGDHADRACNDPDRERLADHRTQHLTPAGADSAQQCHLPQSLRDHNRERVVDDERADDKRDERERGEPGSEESELLVDRVLVLLGDRSTRDHFVLLAESRVGERLGDVGLDLVLLTPSLATTLISPN